MDTLDRQTRSRVMSAVKSHGNRSTERRLRAALVQARVRGWRLQAQELPGAPDFVFDSERLVIFVDGCFWHGCAKCYRRPSSSRKYWDVKVQHNRQRDARNRKRLSKMKWSVMRIWEHELDELDQVIGKIIHRLAKRRQTRLQEQGWRTGTVSEFLELSPKESQLIEKRLGSLNRVT